MAVAAERAMLVDGGHAVENRVVSDERLVALAWHGVKRAGVDGRVDARSRPGAVELRGVVPDEASRAEVLGCLAAVEGVRSVVDPLATASRRPPRLSRSAPSRMTATGVRVLRTATTSASPVTTGSTPLVRR